MKLVRYGPFGGEKPGMLDANNGVRDLSRLIGDVSGVALLPDTLDMLRKLEPDMLPLVEGPVRLGACVGEVRNFIGVGLNYAGSGPPPAQPILFNKAPSCIVGPNDPIMLPRGASKTDFEAEIAVVMGRRGSYIREEQAYDYIAGYCLCNDVTERGEQMDGTGQWVKAKSAPSFGPLGPWLLVGEDVVDVHNLKITGEVNGRKFQNGSSADMIFKIPALVSYVSRFMGLEPGDVITTGTPPGTGKDQDPPEFLKKGDRVRLTIEHLGQQDCKVLSWMG